MNCLIINILNYSEKSLAHLLNSTAQREMAYSHILQNNLTQRRGGAKTQREQKINF
jgi:hypothetical protein